MPHFRSESDARKSARRVLVGAGAAVIALFVAARGVSDPKLAYAFECMHWTVAFAAAAAIAWIGFADTYGTDRRARAWLALGLTLNFAGQLAWDGRVLSHWPISVEFTDVFFLSVGPCSLMALHASFREQVSRRALSLWLDVLALSIVVLTLTLILYLPGNPEVKGLSLAVLIFYPICLLTPVCVLLVLVPSLRL